MVAYTSVSFQRKLTEHIDATDDDPQNKLVSLEPEQCRYAMFEVFNVYLASFPVFFEAVGTLFL